MTDAQTPKPRDLRAELGRALESVAASFGLTPHQPAPEPALGPGRYLELPVALRAVLDDLEGPTAALASVASVSLTRDPGDPERAHVTALVHANGQPTTRIHRGTVGPDWSTGGAGRLAVKWRTRATVHRDPPRHELTPPPRPADPFTTEPASPAFTEPDIRVASAQMRRRYGPALGVRCVACYAEAGDPCRDLRANGPHSGAGELRHPHRQRVDTAAAPPPQPDLALIGEREQANK